MTHTDDVIHQWGPPASQERGCRLGEWRGRGRAGEAVGVEWNGPGIMIGLWDLTTAANRCQESMNLIYSTLGVEGVDGSQCGAKGVVGSESGPAVDVVIVYSEMPSWALGG